MNRLCIPPIRTRYAPRIQLPVQRRMRPLIWRQRNDRVLKRPHIVMKATRITKKAGLHIIPVWHFGVRGSAGGLVAGERSVSGA